MRLSTVRVDRPVRIAQPVPVSVGVAFGSWLGRLLGRLVLLIIRTPAALAGIAVTVGMVWPYRPARVWSLIIAVVLVVGLLVGW